MEPVLYGRAKSGPWCPPGEDRALCAQESCGCRLKPGCNISIASKFTRSASYTSWAFRTFSITAHPRHLQKGIQIQSSQQRTQDAVTTHSTT